MPSALLFNPLNSERSNKQLEDATQQFSVLNVPFQQVPLDLNTEKKNMLILKMATIQSRPRCKQGSAYARNED